MLEKLTLISQASAMARHAAARHRVIAENVANADTPGYRARDIRPFDEMVNAGRVNEGFTLRTSRPEHLPGRGAAAGPMFEAVETKDPAAPNGNSVNLETETIRSVETTGNHALAMGIYRKTVDILRLGLGRNR